MKPLLTMMLCLLLTGLAAGQTAAAPAAGTDTTVALIGDVVSDLRFKDIRGLARSAGELGSHQATVLVFVTSDCPLVKRVMPKLVALDAAYRERGVQLVAVNVGATDTLKDMAAQAIDYEAAFPFVKDEDLACATRLGIERTPEAAVFDSQWRLVYRGRIDDQDRLGGTRPTPSRRDLAMAIDELLAGKPVSITTTPVDGCLITAAPPVESTGPVPTYHHDIAPILAERCTSCHRPDTAAPFELLTYEDVTGHAEMIGEVVRDERMPPWSAHPAYGDFQNDPSLSPEEKQAIFHWIAAGRPEGTPPADPVAEPEPAPEWRIGTPDLVVTMASDQEVQATGFIPYQYVLLPHVFLQETWLEAIEIKPHNPEVVHHCNLAYVTTAGASAETFITGHVPGGQPLDLGHFDESVAYRVPAFAGLVLQIHYTTTGKPEKSRISVGFRFPKRKIQKRLHHVLLDPRGFAITPGDGGHAVRSETTLEHNANLLGMFTHMHLRGKDMTFSAKPPDAPRQTLLMIPTFSFDWQLGYECTPGTVMLPKGTTLSAVAHYDNSTFNPYNPDPAVTVRYGPQSYDEMFNGYIFFTDNDEQLTLTVDPKTGVAIQ